MDDIPKLSNIWSVKLKIPLMKRKYLLFDAMGPFIHFRRYGTKNLFSTLWILTFQLFGPYLIRKFWTKVRPASQMHTIVNGKFILI